MAETSAIEWTDATWNIVTGCSLVSPACTNCYAMRLAGTRLKHLPSRAGLCILVSSLDGEILTNPHDDRGGSFMGPSYVEMLHKPPIGWQHAMDEIVSQYIRELDAIPHHFQLHLLHSFEIVGYKHPETEIRRWFRSTYERLVHDMHLWPETEEQLDERLNDTRAGWLKRADPATVA